MLALQRTLNITQIKRLSSKEWIQKCHKETNKTLCSGYYCCITYDLERRDLKHHAILYGFYGSGSW